MLSVAEPSQLSSDPAAAPAIVVSRVKPRVEALDSAALERPDEAVVQAPHEVLVHALLEQSPGDLAWLAWQDGSDRVVVARDGTSPLQPSAIDEFPEPPRNPLTITGTSRAGAWSLWCRSRGILSCVVVPVLEGTEIVGTIGLASCSAGALDDFDSQRVQLGAGLAIQARRHELRLRSLRRQFDEVSRTLENALALDRALRLPPTYREIARSVAESLDVSYCQIAIRDARNTITIRAGGGRRPLRKVGTAWRLAQLRRCAQALDERRAVVLDFSQQDAASEPERLALFSPTTKRGVLLPFFAGPRTEGVLIVGEERESRCQPLSPERVAILELVASRVAHIMRISRRLEYERMGDRRRQRQLTVERQRLARDVHDEIGQALSALLVQIRCAIAEGNAGPEALKVLEHAASDALSGARTLAFGFRHLERGVGPLEEARAFADTLLRGAQCRLSWTEERVDGRVASRTLREVANVIKEAVSNIVRHASADSARIRVEYPDGRIRVTIQDNGVGFSLQEARPTRDGRGLGLVGCSERLARVGGLFDIKSAPKQGTLVILEAPRGVPTGNALQKVGFSDALTAASL
jgi:signal transduction histidine kinase